MQAKLADAILDIWRRLISRVISVVSLFTKLLFISWPVTEPRVDFLLSKAATNTLNYLDINPLSFIKPNQPFHIYPNKASSSQKVSTALSGWKYQISCVGLMKNLLMKFHENKW